MVKRKTRAVALLAAAALLALPLSACGEDDSLSEEDVQEAAAAAVKQDREQQRLRKLEKQLKQVKAGQGSGSSSSSSGSSGTSSGGGSCGGGVSVGPNTSCPFALNVAEAYAEDGGPSVVAYSPVTNQTYTMTCSSNGAGVTCRGGNQAVVYID